MSWVASALIAVALDVQRLDRLMLHSDLDGAVVAACVTDMDGNALYARNADLRMIPASNQKLLTSAFAIHALGSDHKPETRIWIEPGKVWVEAQGDPTLTFAQLREAASELEIEPDTPIHVRQAFAPSVPPSWENDDLPFRYAPRIEAFGADGAAFELLADENGIRASDPAIEVEVVRTSIEGDVQVRYQPFQGRFEVSGSIPSARSLGRFAQPFPAQAAAKALGGNLVLRSDSPPEREPDHVIQGPPVSELIKRCLEPSDNRVAEHLLMMAAEAQTYAQAGTRMGAFLHEVVGIEVRRADPTDGSGMSRHNAISAAGLCRLLRWANRQPWAGTWDEAMAAPGEGTLRSRLAGVDFLGKTGTLSGVSALSGVVDGPDGTRLAVSIVVNHHGVASSRIKAIEDEFVKIVGTTTSGW